MRTATFVACSAALLPVVAAGAPEQASIPFATTTGIESWRAEGNDTLYIKSRNDRWYKADLFGPCIGLEFDPAIGFVVKFGSSFDRTSSILVDGRECNLSSLVEVSGPPGEQEKSSGSAEATTGRPVSGNESSTAGASSQAPGRASPAQASGSPSSVQASGGQSSPQASARTNADKSGAGARRAGEDKGQPAQARSASIPFADLGGIRDWRAASDELLYIQGRNGQWYRAKLFSTCTGLTFENTIGFAVEPTGSFDKFSSIVVDGRECPVASLTKSDAPPGSRRASADD